MLQIYGTSKRLAITFAAATATQRAIVFVAAAAAANVPKRLRNISEVSTIACDNLHLVPTLPRGNAQWWLCTHSHAGAWEREKEVFYANHQHVLRDHHFDVF